MNEPNQAHQGNQPNQPNQANQANQLGQLRDVRWLRLHALFAPFGVCAVTALLLAWSGQWAGRASLPAAASLVDLGAAIYGMIAVLAERSIFMVFWALEQRRKWAQEREQREREREVATQARVAAARAETQAETETRIMSKLLSAGIIQPDQDLEQWAQENGIELHQLPPYRAARAYQRRRERRAQRRQSTE